TEDVAAATQGPVQRMSGAASHQVRATDDDPRLRAAEQLVTRERHEVGAVGERLSYARLRPEPGGAAGGEPRRRRIEEPGTHVDHERNAEITQRRCRRRTGEPVDPEVRLVHLQ